MTNSIAIAIDKRKPNSRGAIIAAGYAQLVTGVTQSVSAFVRRFAETWFPKATKKSEFQVDQEKVKEALGCSQNYVSELLHGKVNPGLEIVLRLHQLTGVPIQEIVGVTAPAEPQYRMPRPPARTALSRARAGALLRDGGDQAEQVGGVPDRRRRPVR